MIKTLIQCKFCKIDYKLNEHQEQIIGINLATDKNKFYAEAAVSQAHWHICNKCIKNLYKLFTTMPLVHEN